MKNRSLWILVITDLVLFGSFICAHLSIRINGFQRTEAGLYQIDGTVTAGERCVLQSSGDLRLPFIDLDDSLKITSEEGMVSWLVDIGATTQGF